MSGTMTVGELEAGERNNGIQVVFENCVAFTNCISEVNNTQIGNTKYIDVVMSMYNLKEYSNNHSRTSESL